MPSRFRLRHVLPIVGPSAPSRLREAQRVTLTSIERALGYTGDRLRVEVIGARFLDEPLPDLPWLHDAPVLHSSSLDVVPSASDRRLPLLREVLSAAGAVDDDDAIILTNIDIAIQPTFYEAIDEILRTGLDAFTVNRRDVTPRFIGTAPILVQASTGARHPGSDCFIMTAPVIRDLDVGDVLLGVRRVGSTLREAVESSARRYRRFTDLNLTFHLGDDREWMTDPFAGLTAFNEQENSAARERRRRAESTGHRAPPERHPGRRGRPPRLVFAATTARSGTGYLAALLGSVPGIDSVHERPPMLCGPWLHDLAARGHVGTYEDRVVKADALGVLRDQLHGHMALADINHLFLTTQYDVVLDAFDHTGITIVDLRRDPIDVALSMDRLGWFSADNPGWRDWFLEPNRCTLAPGTAAAEPVDPLDLILAHLADVLRRREDLRRATPTVQWIDADLPDIARREGARRLLRQIGFEPPSIRWPHRTQRRPANLRSARKRSVGRATSRAYVSERVDRFLARAPDRSAVAALGAEVRRWRRS